MDGGGWYIPVQSTYFTLLNLMRMRKPSTQRFQQASFELHTLRTDQEL